MKKQLNSLKVLFMLYAHIFKDLDGFIKFLDTNYIINLKGNGLCLKLLTRIFLQSLKV